MQRILAVEDDLDIQELLQNFLQDAGYEVTLHCRELDCGSDDGAELSYFTWHFTLLPVILCIIPLILITAFVPIVCYNKMAQKTVVERLRIAE